MDDALAESGSWASHVASASRPDPRQYDPKSPYFDPASKTDAPRWLLVDVPVLQKIAPLTLLELHARPELGDLLVLKKGNRLSITPVEPTHWLVITGQASPQPKGMSD